MPYLEHDGVTRELPQGETMVGSGSEVDWRLQTINIAPRHFTVHVDNAGVTVLTPYRTHDVDVNGTPVTTPRALTHGDEIIAGAGIFAFLQTLDSTPQAAETPGGGAYLIDIGAGLAYPLAEEAITIGRDPVNHVSIRDPAVSRFHAEIRCTPDRTGFVIRSMGATGTTVNGAIIGGSARPLAEGDMVRIAGTTLRFTTAAPPAILRIVAKADVPAGPRSRQATAIHRAIEPPTVGAFEPKTDPAPRADSGRGRWITVILVLAGALLLVLILREMRQ
jgi:pSer/pThr/pTyr-binding forkhead associated (FHA) protein